MTVVPPGALVEYCRGPRVLPSTDIAWQMSQRDKLGLELFRRFRLNHFEVTAQVSLGDNFQTSPFRCYGQKYVLSSS